MLLAWRMTLLFWSRLLPTLGSGGLAHICEGICSPSIGSPRHPATPPPRSAWYSPLCCWKGCSVLACQSWVAFISLFRRTRFGCLGSWQWLCSWYEWWDVRRSPRSVSGDGGIGAGRSDPTLCKRWSLHTSFSSSSRGVICVPSRELLRFGARLASWWSLRWRGGFIRSSHTAAFFKRPLSLVGRRLSGSSLQTLRSRLDPCTFITLRTLHRGRCSRAYSQSDFSFRCSSTVRRTFGWSAFYTGSGTSIWMASRRSFHRVAGDRVA
jgi:hypothetical protein